MTISCLWATGSVFPSILFFLSDQTKRIESFIFNIICFLFPGLPTWSRFESDGECPLASADRPDRLLDIVQSTPFSAWLGHQNKGMDISSPNDSFHLTILFCRQFPCFPELSVHSAITLHASCSFICSFLLSLHP